MNIKEKIPNLNTNQAFKVPEGYFDTFENRLMDRIRNEQKPKSILTYLKPYVALAASIVGIALVTYVILNSVSDSVISKNDPYSIELIDQAGIILDESVIAESYNEAFGNDYTEWEEEAMTYLASSDVDLLLLLEQ